MKTGIQLIIKRLKQRVSVRFGTGSSGSKTAFEPAPSFWAMMPVPVSNKRISRNSFPKKQ